MVWLYDLGYYGREICFKIDNVAWGKPQKSKKAVPAHLTSRCCQFVNFEKKFPNRDFPY